MAPHPPRPPSRDVHLDEPHRRRRHHRGETGSSAGKAPPQRRRPLPTTAAPPQPPPARSGNSSSKAQAGTHVTSFWGGPDPVPLPPRFARIKRALLAGHEDALEASWARLLTALRHDAEHIDGLGAHLVPSIEFNDVRDDGGDASQTAARFRRDVQRYGVGVVRKVVPREEAEAAMKDTARYVQEQGGAAAAEAIDPACQNLFWSPAQVAMRAHPNVRAAQRFMMSLWDDATDDDEEEEEKGQISTQHPITYADRIRVYGGTDDSARQPTSEQHLHPNGSRNTSREQQQPPSPEDWIMALQSSAGITAQVDNGSLERWEPDGYQPRGGGVYAPIFAGAWERHDPWRGAARRAAATTDLYNGHGACSVLRMFQGVLALSVVEPGMVRLLPSPRAATAYYLLRPFFAPLHNLPELMMAAEDEQEAWERYLAPQNWRLTRDPDTVMHGAVPGHAQRVTERWHPHLVLRRSMITLPTLQPGDYILWHPDLPYHISPSDGSGSSSVAADSLRMLVYIPAAPLTQTSALYLARQRKAFRRGQPGPDFDARNRPTERQDVVAAEAHMERVGGVDALRAMGLAAWDVPSSTPGDGGEEERRVRKASDVVRLANNILFPEMDSIDSRTGS